MDGLETQDQDPVFTEIFNKVDNQLRRYGENEPDVIINAITQFIIENPDATDTYNWGSDKEQAERLSDLFTTLAGKNEEERIVSEKSVRLAFALDEIRKIKVKDSVLTSAWRYAAHDVNRYCARENKEDSTMLASLSRVIAIFNNRHYPIGYIPK